MADNKSSLTQIVQSVLDVSNQAIKVVGELDVVIPPPPPAEGQATEDKQDVQITELVAIKGHVDGVESSLTSIDTKIATSAKQDTQITELQAIKGHVDGVETKLDTLIAQTDGVEGSLSSIDTKVATSANQTSQTTELQAIKNNTARLDYVGRVRLVYSSINVTTGAWVQLLASVGATAVKEIEIFDSSGETLELGVGASGSEISESYVFPGGNGRIPMQIPASARLAIRAVSATANSGEILINLYG